MEMAIALSATGVWGRSRASRSNTPWHERRDFYPEGVASGDPESDSVLLWTRRPPKDSGVVDKLHVEVAEDEAFTRVVASAGAPISEASDWTCRVLVGGLKPARTYWYRFTDAVGSGSRVGRTITAPTDDDPRPVHFAFVSCQNANQGAQNAYRRMIFEDEGAAEEDRLGFVLHLGDFIYEIVGIPKIGHRACMTVVCAISCATNTAKRSVIFIFQQTWETTEPSIATIFTIPICRTRAPVGRLSACGTTMSSAGSAGKACNNLEA